ncbi:hypothetical protein KS4_16160 [Poriferisphaera corsica]|uniref:Uncharacterized protein n=1 Tax=Poriferisphaera corsica TaxID=2528020 RepID=A0A517YTK6_9BACT|nr:hypothetical protein [Poriferisphaera corsica]QDU33565.1 hypothetical protein KS4_16160 [Poriferisphaera corsica]
MFSDEFKALFENLSEKELLMFIGLLLYESTQKISERVPVGEPKLIVSEIERVRSKLGEVLTVDDFVDDSDTEIVDVLESEG